MDLLFYASRFVIICYGTLRKYIHSLSNRLYLTVTFYREETVFKSSVYWYNVNEFGQGNNLSELVFLPKNMEIVNPFSQNV